MKKMFSLLLCGALLTGCSTGTVAEVTNPSAETVPTATIAAAPVSFEVEFVSRYTTVTEIVLSDEGITVDGGSETDAVYTSNDIIYYEDRDTYDSGNPYGEGSDADKHAAEEAALHTVVNITAPGAYRITGKLSAGQIRVDLGDDAYEDPDAVVELILDNADITCTVAPAILFLNTYECDGNWSTDSAKPDVDTSAAGANLILEGENTVNGSYVAKIFKDKEGEKKLWKQDGAIYSYMSLNVFGPGSLDLRAENEGLDTELHLTIQGGDIAIRSGNDGINTNEDGVSVTTINGGTLRILAGLGAEGDGIDSNGYLVINGGTVISSAHPAADAGLDSDLGSYVNGGTVVALGSTMDWAESESGQVTMNLQFAGYRTGAITVAKEDGSELFGFDPSVDPVLKDSARQFMGAVLSCPTFKKGETYTVSVDGKQMQYTGTDVGFGFGGMGFGGNMGGMMPPEGFNGEMPEMPEGMTFPEGGFPGFAGQMPEGFDGKIPEGLDGKMPENFEGKRPENFGGQMPEGFKGERPEGFNGQMPEGFPGRGERTPQGEASTGFYMQDMVNAFSGVTEVTE